MTGRWAYMVPAAPVTFQKRTLPVPLRAIATWLRTLHRMGMASCSAHCGQKVRVNMDDRACDILGYQCAPHLHSMPPRMRPCGCKAPRKYA
jgi:hypothetical protein